MQQGNTEKRATEGKKRKLAQERSTKESIMLENKKTVEKYEFELKGIKETRETLTKQHMIMTSKRAKMA